MSMPGELMAFVEREIKSHRLMNDNNFRSA
jgi:hypothetical protein